MPVSVREYVAYIEEVSRERFVDNIVLIFVNNIVLIFVNNIVLIFVNNIVLIFVNNIVLIFVNNIVLIFVNISGPTYLPLQTCHIAHTL